MHNELKDNSRRSMIKVIFWAIGSAAAVYELVATVGYLSFGRNAKGNIILECMSITYHLLHILT